jgi:hypothetical protein
MLSSLCEAINSQTGTAVNVKLTDERDILEDIQSSNHDVIELVAWELV